MYTDVKCINLLNNLIIQCTFPTYFIIKCLYISKKALKYFMNNNYMNMKTLLNT